MPPPFWDWLAQHHSPSGSVWLVTWKAAHPNKYVSRDAVLDALLAYGWIDGRRKVLDADRTMQLIAPRQQQAWSKSYKDRVASLRRDGLMQPAGELAVQNGKDSGHWTFFDDVDALIVPDDLANAVDLAAWDALAPSYRRNVLRWVKLAKTPATRQKRIAQTKDATAKGIKIAQM